MIQTDSFLPEDLSMARIRTVKPELFKHEELYQAERESGLPLRLAFIGLFTVADREGRFKWRPNEIKLDVLPYDELDFEEVLDGLHAAGFIFKFFVGGKPYGAIPTFAEHQAINNREMDSKLPGPNGPEVQPGIPDGKTFVYLIVSPHAKAFKIGRSRNIDGKLRDIRAMSACPIELADYILGDKNLEAEIYRALIGHRNHGDWFRCSEEAASILGAWFTRASRVSDVCGTRRDEAAENKTLDSDLGAFHPNSRVADACPTPLDSAQGEGKGKEGKGKEGDVCSERKASSPTVISIPLVSGNERNITQADISEWSNLFPAVDVMQELRKMRAWCIANPNRRKTPKGILRFITIWLSREQDKGRGAINPIQPAQGANTATPPTPEHKFDWSHCEICQGDGRLHVRTKAAPGSEPAPDDPVVPFYKLSDPRRIVSLDAEYPSKEWRIVNFRCSCPAGKAKTIPQSWPRLKPPLQSLNADEWPVTAGVVH